MINFSVYLNRHVFVMANASKRKHKNQINHYDKQRQVFMANSTVCQSNMSLTIPNLVPQRPFCYFNLISVATPQKFGNETYDVHVLVSSKTYRKQNKPKNR